MANLFIVHTPLCFFVAQNIIRQENLKDNILLIRNLEDSDGFDDGYKLLKINELWSLEYTLTDSRQWKDKTIRTSLIYIRNERKLMRIIKRHNVQKVFLGNVNDLRFRLAFLRFKSMGIDVAVYEEGLSHYILQTYLSNRKVVLGSILFDAFIQFPSIRLGYLKYSTMSITEFMSNMISVRYNILPQQNPIPEDRPLRIKKEYSKELRKKVSETIKWLEDKNPDGKKLVLYASQPLFGRGFICDPIIRKVILDKLESLRTYLADKLVVIKYHPRETVEEQAIVQNLFKEKDIDFCVMDTPRSIPLEVYLQSISFDRLIAYNSSSVAYSGYAYEYAPVTFYVQDYKLALEREEVLDNRENFILETVGELKYFDFFLNNQIHTYDATV